MKIALRRQLFFKEIIILKILVKHLKTFLERLAIFSSIIRAALRCCSSDMCRAVMAAHYREIMTAGWVWRRPPGRHHPEDPHSLMLQGPIEMMEHECEGVRDKGSQKSWRLREVVKRDEAEAGVLRGCNHVNSGISVQMSVLMCLCLVGCILL